MTPPPLPLLIVSGCLGAGKTTFVRSMLTQSASLRRYRQDGSLLLLVNDFARENVDAALLQQPSNAADSTGPSSSPAAAVGGAGLPTVVPISGGCVCCNRLPDLIAALVSATAAPSSASTADAHVGHEQHDHTGADRAVDADDAAGSLLTAKGSTVARNARWEYAVLECTGLADPTPVVVALLLHPQLRTSVRIDAVVVLVDASTYTVASDPLAGAQLKGCNGLLLNKASRGTVASRAHLQEDASGCSSAVENSEDAWWAQTKRALLKATENPNTKLWVCEYGCIGPFDDLLVGQFLFEKQQSRRYFMMQATSLLSRTDAERAAEEALETQRLGIHTLCFQLWTAAEAERTAVRSPSKEPSSSLPRRCVAQSVPPLDAILRRVPYVLKTPSSTHHPHGKKKPSVWRSKGFFMATEATADGRRQTRQYTWSSEGKYFDYAPVVPPFVALPLDDKPAAAAAAAAGANVDEATSSCIAEVVFIGTFDKDAQQLQSALLDAFGVGVEV